MGIKSVGGIVGWGVNLTVSSCTNYATVSGDYTHIGGIFGCALSSSALSCENSAPVSGYDIIGGISGYAGYYYSRESTIAWCSSNGQILCAGTNFGAMYGMGTNVVQR